MFWEYKCLFQFQLLLYYYYYYYYTCRPGLHVTIFNFSRHIHMNSFMLLILTLKEKQL